ncbi:MAG: arginine deiminase-related protein [Candidatus Sumerlaeota bacterium]
MNKPHFLMCRPDYYNVNYVINPWMEGNLNRPDVDKAAHEWNGFEQMLRERAGVSLIPQQVGLPDMVFAANGAFILNNLATISNYRHPERQGEAPLYEEWLRENHYQITHIPSHVAFEGAGDALHDKARQMIWAAWGFRTDAESHDPLAKIYHAQVASLHLVDQRFYHLDTCFCPLDGGSVIYYPAAFDAQSVQTIEGIVEPERRIVVSEEDAVRFVCNAVEADGDLFVNECSEELEAAIAEAGLRVRRTNLSQFLMAGGANRCLTLRLNMEYLS